MDIGLTITVFETAAWLKERDNFLILTHRRPDGDTIGCAGALVQALREYGKTAYVLYNPEATARYARFVDTYWSPEGYAHENVIIVDTASKELFPKNGREYLDTVSLCIDHHPSNTFFAQLTCIDNNRASCGELIYDILMTMCGHISAATAQCLYVALSTDTGCFAFANTTADTLRIASLLIQAGAPHRDLNKTLFRTRTLGRVRVEAMILSSLEFHFDGAVAISTITRDMLAKANSSEDDIDDIASIPGSIDGVLAGITIRELSSENDCKISVRTSPSINAHEICKRLGGGGHAMAAGASLNLTISEIKKSLLAILCDFFPPKGGALP